MTDEESHVHSGTERLDALEVLREGPGAPTVRPAQGRGHALTHVALRAGKPEDGVQVGMDVHESRAHHEARHVHHTCRLRR